MPTTRWLVTALLGLVVASCASMNTSPTPEVRQTLAPTGKLRVGLYLGAPSSVIKDSATGEMKGVGFDLGKDLARRMGIPFEPIVYPAIGDLISNANTGQWDVTFVSITPERSKSMDFTPPHLGIEFGYLVPNGSSITNIADVDRSGVRVAVAIRGSSDSILSRELKNAEIVRVQGQAGALEVLKTERADTFSAIKSNLFELSGQLPGSRVLEGHYAIDEQGMAIPKGRELASAYARKFIADVRSEGLVIRAVERSGLRGAVEIPSR
jgi:polar amino acid transport system substrate-binding protein